jgi:hypothetical protein
MGRNDGSGGKWYQGNSSGSHKSRLGNGRGRRGKGRATQPKPSQQFPLIQARFQRQDSQPTDQPTDQPTTDNPRRISRRRRHTDGQK